MNNKILNTLRELAAVFCIFYMSSKIIPHYLFAVIAMVFLFASNFRRLLPLKEERMILFFLAFAYINMFSHFDLINTSSQIRSLGIIGVFFTYKISQELSKKMLIGIVWLALLESAVIFYVSFTNIYNVIETSKNLMSNNFLQLYYHARAHGLLPSIGASGIAILVGVLLLDYLKSEFSKKFIFAALSVLIVAMMLCMSRAAVVAVGCFFMLKSFVILSMWMKKINSTIRFYLKIGCVSLLVVVLVYVFYHHLNIDIELLTNWSSGRFELLDNVFSFIAGHALFGNGSWGYLDFIYRSPGIHCHNAFLQLYSTHGAISLFLFTFICTRLNRRNIVYIIPIFVFNLFNYSLFYSFSFLDVIFYYFLTTKYVEEIVQSTPDLSIKTT